MTTEEKNKIKKDKLIALDLLIEKTGYDKLHEIDILTSEEKKDRYFLDIYPQMIRRVSQSIHEAAAEETNKIINELLGKDFSRVLVDGDQYYI